MRAIFGWSACTKNALELSGSVMNVLIVRAAYSFTEAILGECLMKTDRTKLSFGWCGNGLGKVLTDLASASIFIVA
mgnify:CR=1 FL=1